MAKCYNAFLVFHDWKEAFEALDGESCKAILLAMFDYSVSGTQPPEFDDPAAKMAARFIFPAMERRARDAENGRKGGNKRVENAASKGNVDNYVDSAVDNIPQNGEFYPPSTPLEAPLTPPSTLNKTRQDKDKIKQNDIIQDEDEIKQSGCAADVSSVVAMAKSICKWLVIPAVVSEKTVREIVYSGLTDDEYRRLFYTANECDFLQGGGDRGWIATLDWLIEHRDDVIAGKYREWSKPGQSGGNDNSSFDTKEFFELALARSYRDVSTGENNDETT
jgi:hypothetical protein